METVRRWLNFIYFVDKSKKCFGENNQKNDILEAFERKKQKRVKFNLTLQKASRKMTNFWFFKCVRVRPAKARESPRVRVRAHNARKNHA